MELEPDNERAWAGYARASFNEGDYAEARKYYHRLYDNHPENMSYQLNEAVCLTNLKAYEEALKILYKLNYESPDNKHVSQVLAWALTGCGKYEQALKIYKDLLDAEQPQPDDLLNAAYCYWFDKQVVEAVKLFRRYGKQDGIQFNAAAEFAHEAENIRAHGISQIEVQLMVDLLL